MPGTHSITASWAGSSYYNAVTTIATNQKVNKTPVTVTANNRDRAYGAANPVFTPAYSGSLNGDTAGVLTDAPSSWRWPRLYPA
jgi:hypothetical protein